MAAHRAIHIRKNNTNHVRNDVQTCIVLDTQRLDPECNANTTPRGISKEETDRACLSAASNGKQQGTPRCMTLTFVRPSHSLPSARSPLLLMLVTNRDSCIYILCNSQMGVLTLACIHITLYSFVT